MCGLLSQYPDPGYLGSLPTEDSPFVSRKVAGTTWSMLYGKRIVVFWRWTLFLPFSSQRGYSTRISIPTQYFIYTKLERVFHSNVQICYNTYVSGNLSNAKRVRRWTLCWPIRCITPISYTYHWLTCSLLLERPKTCILKTFVTDRTTYFACLQGVRNEWTIARWERMCFGGKTIRSSYFLNQIPWATRF